MTDEIIEIETEYLIQYIMFQARERAEWETYFPENLHRTDEVWEKLTVANVDEIDNRGDGVIEVSGSFQVGVVDDYIRGTWHHPPEVKTSKREAAFTVDYHFEDEGFVDGRVEVL